MMGLRMPAMDTSLARIFENLMAVLSYNDHLLGERSGDSVGLQREPRQRTGLNAIKESINADESKDKMRRSRPPEGSDWKAELEWFRGAGTYYFEIWTW